MGFVLINCYHVVLSACDCEPVWYDLPGALHAGLAADHAVLAQPASPGAQGRGCWRHRGALWVAGRPMLWLCQEKLQGMKSNKHVYFGSLVF